MADQNALLDKIAHDGAAYKQGTPGAREALLSSCNKLLTSTFNPVENMLYTQWAMTAQNSILRLGSETGLFAALAADNGSPKPASELAKMTKAPMDPQLVSRALRTLASIGSAVEAGPDTFAPTPFLTAMAEKPFQDCFTYMTEFYHPCITKQMDWFEPHGFKPVTSSNDTPFMQFHGANGQNFFEYMGKSAPNRMAEFANMMKVWSKDRPKWFQEGYYPVKERLFQGADTSDKEGTFLVDIAGGSGHDVSQFLEAYGKDIPGNLVLEDRPEIIEFAKKSLPSEIRPLAHDFLTEQPVKGARAYYMHSIMHDWEDETNQQILRSIIPAMKPGYSKILLNEFMTPNEGAHWMQASLDWLLMLCLGSKHRTEAEFEEMVGAVGLKIVKIYRHPQGVDSLIELELV